jgi:hypothetical protein
MLEEIEYALSRVPELRIGQIIYSAVTLHMQENNLMCNERKVSDFLFYCPDNKLAHIIRAFVD